MKNWKGIGKSMFITLGASNHTDKERETNDFYATHPKAIDLLVSYSGVSLPQCIWEPSCGNGILSERLIKYGYSVISTDLIDYGYGTGNIDFFQQDSMPDNVQCILTNPPYKYAAKYVIHALSILPDDGLLCLFLKTTFAEGKGRYRDIFSVTPPVYVLQFSERILCAKNADFDYMEAHGGSAVAYAWWIWRKGYKGKTILDWI